MVTMLNERRRMGKLFPDLTHRSVGIRERGVGSDPLLTHAQLPSAFDGMGVEHAPFLRICVDRGIAGDGMNGQSNLFEKQLGGMIYPCFKCMRLLGGRGLIVTVRNGLHDGKVHPLEERSCKFGGEADDLCIALA